MNTSRKNNFQNIILFGFVLMSWLSHSQAQTPTIGTEMPEIIPPSPTVAALMKFEEVPVNLYTGIPNVSVPIFSTKTKGRGLDFSMSLNYHPNSAAVREHASYTGLGWSLMAGGTISRTVRGFPDEVNNGVCIGIYQNNLGANSNVYYTAFNGLSFNIPAYFRYDAFERGKYDTEHDLWQFNFMGHSGKFILKKNSQGNLEVQKLDANIYKIEVDYTFTNANNQYTFNSFTITDDKGFKYLFNVKENTVSSTSVQTTPISVGGDATTISLAQNQQNFVSSFHLKNVKDINNSILIDFTYVNVNEVYKDHSYEDNLYSIETMAEIDEIKQTLISANYVDVPGIEGPSLNVTAVNAELAKLEPIRKINVSIRSVATKKILSIDVKNQCRIDFEHETGRQDTWFTSGPQSVKLKSITIKNYDLPLASVIQKFEFVYEYLTNNMGQSYGASIPLKRLALAEIKTFGKNTTDFQSQKFSYKSSINHLQALSEDYWGNFNSRTLNYCNIENTQYQTNKDYATVDVLEKISYPTGGYTFLNFGSNTYSYEGNVELTDFDSNIDNQTILTDTHYFSLLPSANIYSQCVSLPVMSDETIRYELTLISLTGSDPEHVVMLIKKNGVSIGSLDNCTAVITGNAGDNIELCFNTFNIGVGTNYQAAVKVVRVSEKIERDFVPKEYVYGGGIRINSIEYYEKEGELIKTKNYNYNFPNTLKSSGSLAFIKPIFKYTKVRKAIFEYACNQLGQCLTIDFDYNVESLTTSNLLASKQTSGGFVGYKHVTVSETGNGKVEHLFTSPIDYPEVYENQNLSYPFLPTKEVDYKRGLEISSKIIDNNGLVLKEVDNQYSFVDEMDFITGYRLFSTVNCPGTFKFESHMQYQALSNVCQSTPHQYLCQFLCGNDLGWIQYINMSERYGRSQLNQSITKEYSHLSTGAPLLTQRTETYTYNNINKRIATVTTTDSSGDEMLQEFKYLNPNGDAVNNRISDIQEIKVRKNNQLMSTSFINYQNAPALGFLMPGNIQASKGTQPLETKVIYEQYDAHGNPLTVTQPNGMKTAYIWGYNHTLPVAKIENIAYNDISSALITAINNACNQPTNQPVNEVALTNALNNLRTSLPNAMVTTIKHIPLVGVKEVIDPKGDKITYEYDNFNRLKTVKDKDGNLVSENQYHYRP